jgi:hypothetical protein
MTSPAPSISRQRQAVELALKHARSTTPKSWGVNQSALDMIRGDLAAAVQTLRELEERKADAVEYARSVMR